MYIRVKVYVRIYTIFIMYTRARLTRMSIRWSNREENLHYNCVYFNSFFLSHNSKSVAKIAFGDKGVKQMI